MNTHSLVFILSTIIASIGITSAFGQITDSNVVTISAAPGSNLPGCEDTAEGCYIPKEATVDVGEKIIFSNTDKTPHTFTAGSASGGLSGEFDSGLTVAGSSYKWTPTTVGTFSYFCMVHPWMEGSITVVSSDTNVNKTSAKIITSSDTNVNLTSDKIITSSDTNVNDLTSGDLESTPACGAGTILQDGKCITEKKTESKKGGCLIATATYGSELAPQVQQLRELRDNKLLQTESGNIFMNSFNQFYYSFSPTIADWERQSPILREAVKLTLTPMISSLSILNHVDIDSEESVLVYGISLILLNVGMYFVAPVVVIHTIRKKF